MTKDRLVTVREGVGQEEAKRLLHQHRIEKLLVVDEDYRCVGLITVKDIEKAVAHPDACKDEQGRLRVAAATTVGDEGYERTERLLAAGVDLVIVDTAHGHSSRVLDAVRRIKRLSNAVQVVAGNVATAEGAKALIDAGADAIKVGIGPGSICTTRIVAGVGVPQLTAIMDAVEVGRAVRHAGDRRRRHQIFRRPRQGDRRRRRLRDGGLAARRHRRDARRGVSLSGPLLQGLPRHGLGRRHGARLGRPLLPAGHQGHLKLVPEGIEGQVPYKGPVANVLHQLVGGLRAAMGYVGAHDIAELHQKAQFVRISSAGLRESHVHDVVDHPREPELSRPGVAAIPRSLCKLPRHRAGSLFGALHFPRRAMMPCPRRWRRTDRGIEGHVMRLFGMTLVVLAGLTSGALAEEVKYPDWSGQWARVEKGQPRYDYSKPAARGQEAPLTAEYQAIYAASIADQKLGGQGLDPGLKCIPMGMPRQMSGSFPSIRDHARRDLHAV